jgi:hypothetical protein
MKEDDVGGKKEMIIRLDSIEEESMLVDEKNPLYGKKIPHFYANQFNNIHTTFKSRQKENTHK